MGGGGASDIGSPYGKGGGNRDWGTEKKDIKKGYKFNIAQFNKFQNENPLLSTATGGALDFFKNLPGLIEPLSKLQGQIPGFFNNLQSQVQGLQGQGQGVFSALGGIGQGLQGLQGQLGNIYNSIPGQFQGIEQGINNLRAGLPGASQLTDPLRKTMGQFGSAISNVYNPIVQSGGALTTQQGHDADQRLLASAAGMGSAKQLGTAGSMLLNRDTLKDQRLATYSGLMSNAAGAQGGLAGQIQNIISNDTGLRSGLLGQLAGVRQGKLGLQSGITQAQGANLGQQAGVAGQQGGILGLLSGLTGQSAGLFGQQGSMTNSLSAGQQGLQTGGLNQMLGVGNAATSQFGSLTNPILGYLGSMFSGNQQAQIAKMQADTQAQAAGDAKMGGAAGGALSAVASIAPLLMMSDERVKDKIQDTGLKTPEGVALKTWEYRSRPGVRFLSATAQDVEEKSPESVVTDPMSGVKLIDARRFPAIRISALEAA